MIVYVGYIKQAIIAIVIFGSGFYVGHTMFPHTIPVDRETRIVEKPIINQLQGEVRHTTSYEVIEKVKDPVTGKPLASEADIEVKNKPIELKLSVNGKPYSLTSKTDTVGKLENDKLVIVNEMLAEMTLTAPKPSKLSGQVYTDTKTFGGGIIYTPDPYSGFGVGIGHFKGTTFGSITFPVGNLTTNNKTEIRQK